MKKLLGILWGLIICAAITLLSGCSTTRTVTVRETHTDTLYRVREDTASTKRIVNIKDSISIKDSTVIHVDENGNVKGVDSWHWRNRYLYRSDSSDYYRQKVDSLTRAIRNDTEKCDRKVTKIAAPEVNGSGTLILILISAALAAAVWLMRKK